VFRPGSPKEGFAKRVYAIVRTGGKQYRVKPGDTIYIEQLEVPVGETVTLVEVLLVAVDGRTTVGSPSVAGAVVRGTVLEQGRDRKVRVFKYKHRKHYRRTRGHRQSYTALRIDGIEV